MVIELRCTVVLPEPAQNLAESLCPIVFCTCGVVSLGHDLRSFGDVSRSQLFRRERTSFSDEELCGLVLVTAFVG
jgi:hypothetical protein